VLVRTKRLHFLQIACQIDAANLPIAALLVCLDFGKPRYWQRREDGSTVVGVGGIGGSIERDESVLACLRREVEEELGARVRLDLPAQTCLVHEWQIADTLHLPPGKKRPTPLMLILLPPRLGGPDTPDYLALLTFLTRLLDVPSPRDLFGLLRIAQNAVSAFFARAEWPLEEVRAHPGLTITLNGQPPPNSILRPVLTARAFQALVRAGYAQRPGFFVERA
jgi:8-oxo-dGTP pyrophosphatase MutT (NUDIX family)